MEKINTEESWNKKRIFIALFLVTLLVVGGYFFKNHFLGENLSVKTEGSVKGTNLKENNSDNNSDDNAGQDFKMNIEEAVKEKIDNLKQEVSGLNIMEIASSSPQIQKIINDIKALERYPTNQAKEICKKICGL